MKKYTIYKEHWSWTCGDGCCSDGGERYYLCNVPEGEDYSHCFAECCDWQQEGTQYGGWDANFINDLFSFLFPDSKNKIDVFQKLYNRKFTRWDWWNECNSISEQAMINFFNEHKIELSVEEVYTDNDERDGDE